jgi:hypothetical protein
MSLDELTSEFLPARPLDPFTNRPLIYQPTENGQFKLYSVGSDGQDNGGRFTEHRVLHFGNTDGFDLELETFVRH